MNQMSARRSTFFLLTTVGAIVAIAALLGRVGADAQWLAALGRVITQHHAIPDGIPFAAAPTSHWPNALVLAELVFSGLERALGDRGLLIAQLLTVGTALWVLARDAIAGGADAPGTSAALLVAAGAVLPSLAIARVQMFSLVLFPVVAMLLRAEARRPSWRIWIVVPLLALWSNLHGAALLGLCVVLAYLSLSRLRQQPLTAIAVAITAVVALSLTPALLRTSAYYDGVLTNVAAQRGLGLWGPISLSAPLDVVLLVAVSALALRLRRAGPAIWELVVIAALSALTLHAARSGVWLLFFLVAPAARTFHPQRTWDRLIPLAAAAALVSIGFALVRGPLSGTPSPALVARALRLAHGSPVLASDTIAERVALDGGRIWIGDPIDAFSRSDQATYLDWLQGSPAGLGALRTPVNVVLVSSGSPAMALMEKTSQFARVDGDKTTQVYLRRDQPAAAASRTRAISLDSHSGPAGPAGPAGPRGSRRSDRSRGRL